MKYFTNPILEALDNIATAQNNTNSYIFAPYIPLMITNLWEKERRAKQKETALHESSDEAGLGEILDII